MTGTSDLTNTIMEFAQGEFKALVAVETAERLAFRACQAVEAGDATEALRILDALTSVTTTRTVTAVKIQAVSDAISQQASTAVAQIMAKAPEPTEQPETTSAPILDWDEIEDVAEESDAIADAMRRAVSHYCFRVHPNTDPLPDLTLRVDRTHARVHVAPAIPGIIGSAPTTGESA